MRIGTLLEPGPARMVGYLNYKATRGDTADESARLVAQAFGIDEQSDDYYIIPDKPRAAQVAELSFQNDRLLVYDHGGDGTTNLTIAAIIGNVRNNPDQTEDNRGRHARYARNTLLVDGVGGNACNFAFSALGTDAVNLERLQTSERFRIGDHYPLEYTVFDESRNVHSCGIVTSCFGAGASADVAIALSRAKPELSKLSAPDRLWQERRLVARTWYNAPKHKVHVAVGYGDTRLSTSEYYDDFAGIELIGSKVYAKDGQTRVNIDDPEYEVLIARHTQNRFARMGAMAVLGARLKTHILPRKPLDFTDRSLSITNAGSFTMPLHTDGETGIDLALAPNHTVELRLSRIGALVLMEQ